jgi:hypothetical protein
MKTNLKPSDLKSRIMKKSEAIRKLTRVIYTDAVKAGWLKPCAVKPGKNRPIASIFYRAEDVEAVENRILKSEYPVAQ